jgi:hypothetical protein
MRTAFFFFILLFLTACVSIPDEELAPPVVEAEPAVEAPAAAETPAVPNTTPLAPLPEEPKQNSTPAATPQPAATPPAQKPSQYAWTTESLSIEEGETKIVYVKKE